MTPILKALASLANILPGWLWAALCAGLALANCSHTLQRDSARSDLAGLRADVAEREGARAELARLVQLGVRAAQSNHEAALAAINRKASDENNRLAADVRRLAGSLQQRPERPGSPGGAVPTAGTGAVGCTGSALYRADGAFLVGEAARADGLRIQLAECRARYDAGVALTGGWNAFFRAAAEPAAKPVTPLSTPKGN
jgi:hypothetical protein